MSDSNLSLVLYGKQDIRLTNRPVPEPGPGQVQLAIKHVGICGSDLSFFEKGRIGHFTLRDPFVLGHEASGVVSKIGDGVTNLAVGDKVAINPIVPCRQCHTCEAGRFNVCVALNIIGVPSTNGCLARWIVHDAKSCHKLPENVSTEEGALMEPLAVAVHACRRAGVTLGSKVLVCGAGPIGLLAMMAAKSAGASSVCITDVNQKRLDVAKQLGADIVLNVSSTSPKDIPKLIVDAMGCNPTITLECSGVQDSVQAAVSSTMSGGCVVMVGIGPADMNLPVLEAILREVDIRGSHCYVDCFPAAIALVASGKVNVKPFITHRFNLEDSVKAFDAALNREGMKVQITCGQD